MMQDRHFSRLQEGLLALADISGYTSFITQTEVDHNWEILHELLELMVRSAEGKLEVSQVEGDAILFISQLSDEEVVTVLEQTFIAFRRRLRDMQAVTTCPCNACKAIGILKLKFVLHRGQFSRQRLGGIEQLHGQDVIVAHRLLKNKVPAKEYILATRPVLEHLSEGHQARFTPYQETYDLGEVAGGYEQIGYLWEQAQAQEHQQVEVDEALIDSAVTVDGEVEVVRGKMLQPAVMERYLMADKVESFGGARGEEVGLEFHCHHGYGINYLRVVKAEGDEMTLVSTSPVGDIYITTRLESEGPGRTRVRRLWWWRQPEDAEVAAGTMAMLQGMSQAGDAAMVVALTA